MSVNDRLYVALLWRPNLWALRMRGRFIAQRWSLQLGPLAVSFYDPL